jgi:HNH endonuclease
MGASDRASSAGDPAGLPAVPSTLYQDRGWAHERASRQVRFEETICWICGEPAKPGDPSAADHIVPRANGGQDVRENMRAAHRSRNSRRGAGGGGYMGIAVNAGRRLTPDWRAREGSPGASSRRRSLTSRATCGSRNADSL